MCLLSAFSVHSTFASETLGSLKVHNPSESTSFVVLLNVPRAERPRPGDGGRAVRQLCGNERRKPSIALTRSNQRRVWGPAGVMLANPS